MAVTPPVRTRLYKIPEAAKTWNVPLDTLYKEIAAGRLKAKVRRGNIRGFMVTEAIMDDWIENSLVDASEAYEHLSPPPRRRGNG
ncbi:MAG: helix-turn-helix domain-containing protein [Coriobacteriaceae bacterium]|jgi:hypothetical protein|nr:helix-turn-helix domain-containing protein [Coriobacteriaceae bacterium]